MTSCRAAILWLSVAASAASCRVAPRTIPVAVVFRNSWTIRGESLDAADIATIKRSALDTLGRAYAGFALVFAEGTAGARTIRIEDTPYASDPRDRMSFGAAGVTYPVSTSSSVRFDVLANLVLTAAACENLTHCGVGRLSVIQALGAGIGATAAHELGHQAGFEFSRDSDCADCYDGRASASREHFFSDKHWSADALQAMTRKLPVK